MLGLFLIGMYNKASQQEDVRNDLQDLSLY